MKKLLCTPGNWDLIFHEEKRITSLFRIVFIETSKIALTFNGGWVTIFYIKNNIFNRVFHGYGFNPQDLSFNRTR